jgi:hypothetical protein
LVLIFQVKYKLQLYLYNDGANGLDWFTISSLISKGIALKIAHSLDIHIALLIAVLGD